MNAYVIDFTYTETPFSDITSHRMCVIADSYGQAIANGIIELDGLIQPSTIVNTELVAKYKDVII